MTVAQFITKLRRFARDLPITAGESFDGDASTTTFRLRNYPVLEEQYSIKISGTTTTAYTIDRDTGVITFDSAPASGSDNVTVNYKYAKLSDTEWLDVFNSVIQSLRFKIWADSTDSSTFTTVANQSEYDMDSIDSNCFSIVGLWYRSSSNVDWTSISADTNVKYYREQNKIVLRPYLQVNGYAMKVRYLTNYSEYSATTETITIPTRYLKPIEYFCIAEFIDRLVAITATSTGGNVREDSFEALNNLLNWRNNMERTAEKLLSRVKPRRPSTAIKTIIAKKID